MKLKINWNVRSTYLIIALVIDMLIGIVGLIFTRNLEMMKLWAVMPMSLLVFELLIFMIVNHFFPETKRWWFSMKVFERQIDD